MEDVVEVLSMVPHIVKSSYKKMWIDYDEEADVVYINFVYPPIAVEHEEDENELYKKYKKIFRRDRSKSTKKSFESNRKSSEKNIYHVNPQNPVFLRRILRRCGFDVEMYFGTRISKKIPFWIRKRLMFLRGMWCVCIKEK